MPVQSRLPLGGAGLAQPAGPENRADLPHNRQKSTVISQADNGAFLTIMLFSFFNLKIYHR